MPVTIDEISRHLGVSVSTVSKALNDYNDVSPTTKRRVLEAASDLGYHPSAAARNLRRQRTDKLGFSYGFPTAYIGEFASRLINGAVAAAEQKGYNITLYPFSGNRLEQLARISRAREVDGWLLMGGEHWEQTVSLFKQEGMPLVLLNRHVDDPDVSFVTSDVVQASTLITEHLLGLGHRRIALVTRAALETDVDRVAGYRHALAQAGVAYDDRLTEATAIAPGTAYRAMNRLLDLPEPPTAVIGTNDPVAIECLHAIKDRGLRVPQDVAVTGADNLRESLASDPPLTTLHPNLSEIGRLATEALLEQIVDPARPATRIKLPVRLIIRQSTAG
jgi:LacI family transcriptional regulator